MSVAAREEAASLSGAAAATTDGAADTAAPKTKGVKGALRGHDYDAQAAMLAPSENAPGGAPPASVSVDSSSFERWVQSAVSGLGAAHGFLGGPLPVDGKLGAATRGAVKAFQKATPTIVGRPIGVDGIVGRDTTTALEQATASSAPSVKEKDRAAPPTPAPVSTVGPAGGGGGGAQAGGGGDKAGAPAGAGGGASDAAPDAKAQAKQAAKDEKRAEVKPVEAPKDGEEKKQLADGDQADKVIKPGAIRSGPAGKADAIRQRFAQGILVSLSIPAAYDSVDEVIQHVDDGNALDAYAYDQNFPKWAQSNPGAIQGYWTQIRAANPKMASLPEQFAGAGDKLQGKIIGAVKGNKAFYKDIKNAMWSDATWKQKCAATAVANNKFIPDSAQSFAKAQGAIDGAASDVKIGGAMIYNKPGDMGPLVSGTSANVKALLDANPPAEGSAADQAAKDDATSKVRFLTISSHGWPTGMGGHGHAKDATFNQKKVPEIIGSMAGALANDVRLRLFACQTSHIGNGNDAGEGSLADIFRDELLKQGKGDAAVIGHTESGHTQENSTTRFFHGDAEGKKSDDWRGKAVFDGKFARAYLKEIDAPETAANEGSILDAMRRFFSRECWMGDISSLDALTASSHKMWQDRYPDYDSVKGELKDKRKR